MCKNIFLTHKNKVEKQNKNYSYVGGKPMLPSNISIPITKETNAPMTFFFQITFPKQHPWEGFTLSIFSTTDFVDSDEEFLIPTMLEDELYQVIIPKNFLINYQKYFKVFIFKTDDASIVEDYKEIIQFNSIEFKEIKSKEDVLFGSIKNDPVWVLDDESPKSYNNTVPMQFLFQTKLDYTFKRKSKDTLRQTILDPITEKLGYSWEENYELFLANETYYFGTKGKEKMVYIITQT